MARYRTRLHPSGPNGDSTVHDYGIVSEQEFTVAASKSDKNLMSGPQAHAKVSRLPTTGPMSTPN